MIRIEAKTLQEAFSKAAKELSCSVTEVDIEIIQNPSSGFLGMFRKTAIIEARRANEPREERKPQQQATQQRVEREQKTQDNRPPRNDEKRKNRNNRRNKNKKPDAQQQPKEQAPVPPKEVRAPKPQQQPQESPKQAPAPKIDTTTIFDQEFHKPKVDVKEAVVEIKANINKLFRQSCFTLEAIKVEAFDETTVLIEFSGEDSALLIGKEGYRYKALSYLLYNWINLKYNLNIRLEIAEFLKNQEEMIDKYLVSVIERVNNNGRAQTKILDGVLVKIALEALRAEFPNKYVGIKTGREGGKFIVINDFNRKNS